MKKENITALKLVTGELIIAFCEFTNDSCILNEPVTYEDGCSDYLYFSNGEKVEISRKDIVFYCTNDIINSAIIDDYIEYLKNIGYSEINGEFKI